MPIRFISQYVRRNQKLFPTIEIAKKTSLVIDGEALLYHIYQQSQNFSLGGDNQKLYQATIRFFENFAFHEFKCTVIVPTPHTELEKNDSKIQQYSEIMTQITNDPLSQIGRSSRGFRFHPAHRIAFIQALKDAKVNYMCVDGDCIAYAVDYATSIKAMIMGYDSVYLGHEVSFALIDSIKFETERLKSKGDEGTEIVTCMVTSANSIAQSLQLTIKQLQYMLRLLPNDYMMELTELRQTFEQQGGNTSKDPKDNMIVNLAKFIKEKWVDDEQKMNAIILEREQQSYDEQVAEKKIKMEQIDKIIDGLHKQKLELEKKEQNDHVVAQLSDNEKSIKAKQVEKDSIQITPINIKLTKEQLEKSALLFTTKPASNPIQNIQSGPEWLLKFFKFGKLPVFLYQALTEKAACFTPALEDQKLDGSSKAAQSLRKTLYSLVGLENVTEVQRNKDQFQSEIIKINKSSIDLNAATKMSVDDRQKIVLQLIVGDQFAKQIQNLTKDQHLQFSTAVLIYMLQNYQNDISMECLSALLTTVMFPLRDNVVGKLMQNSQIERNIDGLHIIAVHQNIIDAAYGINAIFGAPLQIQIQQLALAPTFLAQLKEEQTKESVLRQCGTICIKNIIPEDLLLFNQRKKTSQRLTKQEMQLSENLEGIKLMNLIITEMNLISKLMQYQGVEEDSRAKMYNEKQEKKAKAQETVMTKENKFAALDQE